jgi:thiamine-phosphate pyrophosphorylase
MDRKAQPHLILFTPVIGEIDNLPSVLAELCSAADVAAVILRTGQRSDDEILSSITDTLAAVQNSGAALILEGHPQLAAKMNSDGAHLASIEALQSAIPMLKPGRIAGAGRLVSRHDAMTAGEAGADYVMFGEPDAAAKRPALSAIIERISWWAEIFEVPCVAYAANLDEIEEFVHAGADFIALNEDIWRAAENPLTAIRKATKSLQVNHAPWLSTR